MGPTLINIFLGFHERGLLSSPSKPVVYFRYVDDAFCLFNKDTEADLIFNSINKIYPAFKFTLDEKTYYTLLFLDVLFRRTTLRYVT